ncbi:MAG: lysine transporter LysE, partial [Thermoplasmata archaeon]
MNFAYSVLFGLALGFSLTIPPGPMNALIASQTVRSLRDGVITGFGAMSADLALGVLVYAFRSAIDLGSVVRWVYLVGAGVMIFLGSRLLLKPALPGTPPASGLRTYSQG